MKKILRAIRDYLFNNFRNQEVYAVMSTLLIEQIKNNEKYNKNSLIKYGHKIYSQTDEDGIVEEIFRRIGTTNKKFVEIGIGDGRENNTLALLFKGWSGVWIDGNVKGMKKINKELKHTIDKGVLFPICEFINKNNINNLISKGIQEKEVDLLSIDIDGNDYHILENIDLDARVIIMEYNAKLGAHVEFCLPYKENHVWDQTDNFGVSLKFLEIKLKVFKKGYSLVGCGISGANAFFVRNDLIENKFDGPFTSENLFEPCRYWLAAHPFGHPTSLATLENHISKSHLMATPK